MKFTQLAICLISAALPGAAWSQQELVRDDYDPFDPESVAPLPFSHLPKSIILTYRAFDVPLLEASELVSDQHKSGNQDALYRKLCAMVKQGDGELAELAQVKGRPGEMVMSESIDEIIYPTDYLSPGLQAAEKGQEKARATLSPVATPTDFETRNTGLTLELEATLADQEWCIDCRVAIEDVELLGYPPLANEGTLANQHLPKGQPEFYTQRLSQSVSLDAGHYHLIGITTPLDDDSKPSRTHRRLHFLSGDIEAIGYQK